MIKNYLILAIRVLGRKKFFTFISLFGISFTLAILMLIMSFLQAELGNEKPFTNRDKMVIFNMVEMQNVVADTTMMIDSSKVGSEMVYDTTYSYGENSNSTSMGSLGGQFLLDHFSALPSAVNRTFFIQGVSFNAYVNNSKIVIGLNYTDHNFWEIMDFEFIEGRGYDEEAFERAEPVTVITTKLAKEYFGEESGIVGREVKMDGINHKVIGLVEKPRTSMVSADAFAPSTLSNFYPGEKDNYTGGFNAIFIGENAKAVERIKDEIRNKESTIPMDIISNYNTLVLDDKPNTVFESYARSLLYLNDGAKAGRILRWILIGFIGLFVLLPTLNLINLNVSRIMERSSEIGVRKAFGAKKSNILGQFVFENVVLTIIGGLIGFILALFLINFINTAQLIDDVQLSLNFKFFVYSFIIIILFGIISGILPAYRMSKLQIVNALKENKL